MRSAQRGAPACAARSSQLGSAERAAGAADAGPGDSGLAAPRAVLPRRGDLVCAATDA